MVLDENTGEVISVAAAKKFIDEFDKQYPEEVKGFFIGSNHVRNVLIQEDCIGIRIYNGYNDTEERMNQVLVGVDSQENDMKNGIVLDDLAVCPPYCPINSLLD